MGIILWHTALPWAWEYPIGSCKSTTLSAYSDTIVSDATCLAKVFTVCVSFTLFFVDKICYLLFYYKNDLGPSPKDIQ